MSVREILFIIFGVVMILFTISSVKYMYTKLQKEIFGNSYERTRLVKKNDLLENKIRDITDFIADSIEFELKANRLFGTFDLKLEAFKDVPVVIKLDGVCETGEEANELARVKNELMDDAREEIKRYIVELFKEKVKERKEKNEV